MHIIVNEGSADGTVLAPPSKSYTHRALICSLLAEGISEVRAPLICDDTESTINACKALGARIRDERHSISVEGPGCLTVPEAPLDCNESASTMRMVLGISALVSGDVTLTGGASLTRRPIDELVSALSQIGVECECLGPNGHPPVTVHGKGGIAGGFVAMRGDVSSQYISSLLFACPLAQRNCEIAITTKVESLPYVEMTVDVLNRYGIDVSPARHFRGFDIAPGQRYAPTRIDIEGDYSSSAFLLAAGALTGDVTVRNLNPMSIQGDSAIVGVMRDMGADMALGGESCTSSRSSLGPIDLDCSGIPDLVPILSVLATQANGRSRLTGLGRLRIKESDRIASIYSELSKMGAKIKVEGNSLIIDGKARLKGADLDSHNDHRIAMSLAVAAMAADGPSRIAGAECINKSYPGFIDDMLGLGVGLDVI